MSELYDDERCDNCGSYCLLGNQVKVDAVDGTCFMCPECATEFAEVEDGN